MITPESYAFMVNQSIGRLGHRDVEGFIRAFNLSDSMLFGSPRPYENRAHRAKVLKACIMEGLREYSKGNPWFDAEVKKQYQSLADVEL